MAQGSDAARAPSEVQLVGPGSLGLSRLEWRVLALGFFVTSVAVLMTRFGDATSWVRFWDNVHWTVSYGTATLLCVLSRRRATGPVSAVRRFFVWSLAALFAGQLLWDLQVFVGWNPFPGPSDAFFVSMGPLAILAVLQFTQGQSRSKRLAILLDGLGFLLSVLALTLATYLPHQGTTPGLTMTVLAAYPTALLTATALFAVVMLELRKRPNFGIVALWAGLFAHGLLWMEWNLFTLEGKLDDGILLNYLYSYATLLLGVGVAACELPEAEIGRGWSSVYRASTRSLPLGFVVAAGFAVILADDLMPAVRHAVNLCMGGVIIVAVLRQSLLLEEGQRRLEAETQYRAISERMAASQRLEALGTLASGIAHDFNNLLTAILGHAELLRDRKLGAEEQESIEAVRSAAVRAQGVVQRILAFSRHEAVEKEPVDARELVEEVQALLQAALPARHVISVIASAPVGVLANPAQIHQVLMNLGTNASHAIGERAGNIKFEIRPLTLDSDSSGLVAGSYAEISVIDDGDGMDAATQARIFEPFFTTKGRDRGTGLGLSVAHGIVSEHGGTIRVTSEKGVGTTLRLLLPTADLPAVEPEQHSGVVPTVVASAREALVVDDEVAVAQVVARMLRRLGQATTSLNSPEAAIERVASDPDRFWLIITDMSMPSLSGVATAERLREVGFTGTLVLSSGTDFAIAGTPFDDVLPKPYQFESLRSLVVRNREKHRRASDRSA